MVRFADGGFICFYFLPVRERRLCFASLHWQDRRRSVSWIVLVCRTLACLNLARCRRMIIFSSWFTNDSVSLSKIPGTAKLFSVFFTWGFGYGEREILGLLIVEEENIYITVGPEWDERASGFFFPILKVKKSFAGQVGHWLICS